MKKRLEKKQKKDIKSIWKIKIIISFLLITEMGFSQVSNDPLSINVNYDYNYSSDFLDSCFISIFTNSEMNKPIFINEYDGGIKRLAIRNKDLWYTEIYVKIVSLNSNKSRIKLMFVKEQSKNYKDNSYYINYFNDSILNKDKYLQIENCVKCKGLPRK